MKNIILFFSAFYLFLMSCNAMAQRPDFKKNEAGFTTSNFTVGNSMDIALIESKVALIVQKASEKGDKLAFFSNEGELKSEIEIDKMNASAITTANNKLYVMSRNVKAFIREFDTEGKCLQTFALKNKPAGTYYGLAVLNELCYFTVYLEESKSFSLYSYNTKTESLTLLTTKSGKAFGVSAHENSLLINVEPTNPSPGNILYYAKKDGNITDSVTFLKGLGIESYNGNIVTLKRGSKGNSTVVYTKIDNTLKKVYFEPKWRNATIEQTYKNESENPAKINVYFTKPSSNEYQEVSNLIVKPSGFSEKKDKYNNTWMVFTNPNLSDSMNISLNFDIYTYNVIYTIPYNSTINSKVTTGNVSYTEPTDVFDYEAPVFNTVLASYTPSQDFTSNVVLLRNIVNNTLTVNGPSGPESKASSFMESTFGRCYAHTIGLAAVLRKQNIATSAIGGINLTRSAVLDDNKEDVVVHTWNRIYHPSGFWFDVDAVADDDKEGNHKLSRFGYHNGDYYISYIGDYEKKDLTENFAQRGWIRCYEYSSLNKGKKAKIKQNALKVTVK